VNVRARIERLKEVLGLRGEQKAQVERLEDANLTIAGLKQLVEIEKDLGVGLIGVEAAELGRREVLRNESLPGPMRPGKKRPSWASLTSLKAIFGMDPEKEVEALIEQYGLKRPGWTVDQIRGVLWAKSEATHRAVAAQLGLDAEELLRGACVREPFSADGAQ
jgi:hypothetical protein